jgi:hypothetical protein
MSNICPEVELVMQQTNTVGITVLLEGFTAPFFFYFPSYEALVHYLRQTQKRAVSKSKRRPVPIEKIVNIREL